jgi:integrase
MASISTDARGNRTVQFIAKDGKRRSLRLGRVTIDEARDVKRHIERILNASKLGNALKNDQVNWLAGLDDDLYDRVVAVGLAEPRERRLPVPELGAFLADFIAKRAGSKESTLSSIRVSAARLTAYFGEDAPLDSITPGQADDWFTWMRLTKKYAVATISRTVKHAKRFFRSAVRLGLIEESPFGDLKAKRQSNTARQEFVSQEIAAQVLDALPDAEWRLIFALSRYGGLRCPSEHLALTWPDIDWDRNRFRVEATKTGERWVPIFAELRPYLEDAFELADEGAVHVITRRRASSQRWGVLLDRILKRAGIKRWPKIFHNLRASRESELTALYSIGTVCRWLGNSIKVADLHYLSALEAEFDRAAKQGAISMESPKALQIPVQQTEPDHDLPLQTSTDSDSESVEIAGIAEKQPGRRKSQGG